jgi:hypothetical protein
MGVIQREHFFILAGQPTEGKAQYRKEVNISRFTQKSEKTAITADKTTTPTNARLLTLG